MNVIGHEAASVQSQLVPSEDFSQGAKVGLGVSPMEKDVLLIVAALHDVMGKAGYD